LTPHHAASIPRPIAGTVPDPAEERHRLIEKLRERRKRRLERLPAWIRRYSEYIPDDQSVKKWRIARLMGKGFFRRELWSFKPQYAAMGVGIGAFVMVTPTPGIQAIFAILLCYLLRGNIPIAFFMSWISNPFTTLPINIMNLWAGYLVLGMKFPEHIDMDKITSFTWLFKEALLPITIGSLVIGSILGVLGYFAAFGFAHWQRRSNMILAIKERYTYKLRIKERMQARMLRRMQALERQLAGDTSGDEADAPTAEHKRLDDDGEHDYHHDPVELATEGASNETISDAVEVPPVDSTTRTSDPVVPPNAP